MQSTTAQEIDHSIQLAKEYFMERFKTSTQGSKGDIDIRKKQLMKLYFSIKDHQDEIVEALKLDFHRAEQETLSLELIPLINDILHMIDSLTKWTNPKRVTDWSPLFLFGSIKVQKIARGVVLVIAPFNFPLLLALKPVAFAIAGGNSVILKPSELTPNISKVIGKIINKAQLPQGLLSIVTGGKDETSHLIKSPNLDYIFFTGSTKVGSIIASEAGKNLTPVTLELGGKSPVFITENAKKQNLKILVKRLFFGAFVNSGQLCVRPDFVLVHESKFDELLAEMKVCLNEMFPTCDEDIQFSHMISETAYDKTINKLLASKGKFLLPSAIDHGDFLKNDYITQNKEKLFIPPTIIHDVDWYDATMSEENFAPILPIVKYDNLDAAIEKILANFDTPLVQYIFSDSQTETNHILSRIRSGDALINETIIHVGIQETPFGGIGNSGFGNYGGQYGFDSFTHERTILKQPFWMDWSIAMRYLPYTSKKSNLIQRLTENKPNFNRDLTRKFSWINWSIGFVLLSISMKFWNQLFH